MKLLILLLPLYVIAAVSTIQLYVKSDNKEIDGRPISIKLEQYPVYSIFIGDEPSYFSYDDVNHVIYYDNKVRFFLNVANNILQLSPDPPLCVDILEDGKLLDGYGVKSIKDSQLYGGSDYGIWYGQNPPIDALPLSIYAYH
ncbi:hypothetical protein SBY92_002216 [Candida maltosa Xu316]|uniref:Uncharacterized protein n=1 Tax=Candida maltosa (strain Xu316) TaxID=1245528 RepID=M3JX80_CANMX|nr:hypothetical protein G210_2710 [Candida maltosa Xu316]